MYGNRKPESKGLGVGGPWWYLVGAGDGCKPDWGPLGGTRASRRKKLARMASHIVTGASGGPLIYIASQVRGDDGSLQPRFVCVHA